MTPEPINLQKILENDNLPSAIDKINNNFEKIAFAGGGPAGKRGYSGVPGIPGPPGIAGQRGPKGDSGTPGSQWYTGNYIPDSQNPSNINVNDYYLRTDTYDFYKYVNTGSTNTWVNLGKLGGSSNGSSYFSSFILPDYNEDVNNIYNLKTDETFLFSNLKYTTSLGVALFGDSSDTAQYIPGEDDIIAQDNLIEYKVKIYNSNSVYNGLNLHLANSSAMVANSTWFSKRSGYSITSDWNGTKTETLNIKAQWSGDSDHTQNIKFTNNLLQILRTSGYTSKDPLFIIGNYTAYPDITDAKFVLGGFARFETIGGSPNASPGCLRFDGSKFLYTDAAGLWKSLATVEGSGFNLLQIKDSYSYDKNFNAADSTTMLLNFLAPLQITNTSGGINIGFSSNALNTLASFKKLRVHANNGTIVANGTVNAASVDTLGFRAGSNVSLSVEEYTDSSNNQYPVVWINTTNSASQYLGARVVINSYDMYSNMDGRTQLYGLMTKSDLEHVSKQYSSTGTVTATAYNRYKNYYTPIKGSSSGTGDFLNFGTGTPPATIYSPDDILNPYANTGFVGFKSTIDGTAMYQVSAVIYGYIRSGALEEKNTTNTTFSKGSQHPVSVILSKRNIVAYRTNGPTYDTSMPNATFIRRINGYLSTHFSEIKPANFTSSSVTFDNSYGIGSSGKIYDYVVKCDGTDYISLEKNEICEIGVLISPRRTEDPIKLEIVYAQINIEYKGLL